MANEKDKKLEKEQELALFENQKIVDVGMEREVKKSFIEYSMSVIMARALPDVRDGMKPGARRILYAMYEDGLVHSKPFRKSATTVGNVLGRYHPHGDAAVYGTMVRMAQDFSLRYPLVEGHGNFGSVDGDPPAAYRYTEARLDKIADEMMRDLDKNVVPMMPNFDNRLQEPTVLPSRFPNLLVNGSMGIAVGMATNIPPHNLGEVIDATIYRMDNPESTVDELMEYIKGPDFPTYATIYGVNGIKEAYLTGKGHIMVRATAEVDEDKRQIVITEIPYGVNKSMLCAAIGALVKDKRVDGISELRDESDRKGMRIVIDLKREANGHVLLNQLYRYTQLQDTCAVNMLAIVKNEPKVLNLAQILDYYIEHQELVITNRVKYDLAAALRDAHIYEGYKLALDNIDEVISIIRSSPDTPTAKINLMKRFDGPVRTGDLMDLEDFAAAENPGLSEEQAQAIVSLTLGRLSGLERKKIEDRLTALHAAIKEYREILGDINRIKQIIKEEMLDIKNRYAQPRRTRIEAVANEIIDEDLVEKQNCVLTLTHAGYIKRQATEVYSAQKRGGKGVMGMATKEEDYIEKVVSVHSHSTVMMFTNTGKVQCIRGFQIPEASRTAKGTNVVNLLQLSEGEKITSMIAVSGFNEGEYLVMVTRNGVIKRTLLSEFAYQRKGGKIAITLDEGDELLYVIHTTGDREIIIATAAGNAVRFEESNVRCMGRSARGVRGIALREGEGGRDRVVGAVVVNNAKHLVTVTERGYGKRSPFDDFRTMANRGGFGVRCHNITDKTGLLAGISAVDEDADLMMITDQGTIIRTPASDLSILSRSASGVIVMRLPEDQYVANFTVVASEENEDPEGTFSPASDEVFSETDMNDDVLNGDVLSDDVLTDDGLLPEMDDFDGEE